MWSENSPLERKRKKKERSEKTQTIGKLEEDAKWSRWGDDDGRNSRTSSSRRNYRPGIVKRSRTISIRNFTKVRSGYYRNCAKCKHYLLTLVRSVLIGNIRGWMPPPLLIGGTAAYAGASRIIERRTNCIGQLVYSRPFLYHLLSVCRSPRISHVTSVHFVNRSPCESSIVPRCPPSPPFARTQCLKSARSPEPFLFFFFSFFPFLFLASFLLYSGSGADRPWKISFARLLSNSRVSSAIAIELSNYSTEHVRLKSTIYAIEYLLEWNFKWTNVGTIGTAAFSLYIFNILFLIFFCFFFLASISKNLSFSVCSFLSFFFMLRG